MSVDVTKLILGPGQLYGGTFGSVTEPVDADINTTPAATSGFEDVGGTLDGVKLTIGQTFATLAVDQIVDTAGRRLTARDFTMETNLAEPTLDNLSLVMNDTAPTTAANSSSFEPTTSNSATQPNYKALLFDGWAPNSKRRRIFARKMLSSADVAFAYDKENQTVFTATFSGHYVSPSIKTFKIVDDTTE